METIKIIPIVKLPEDQRFDLSEAEYEEFQKLEEVELNEDTANYLISLNYARRVEE